MEQNFNSDYSNDYSTEENEKISVFDAWIDALASPNKEMYEEIGNAQNASIGRALLWVFIAVLIGGIVSAFVEGFVGSSQFDQVSAIFAEYGMEMPFTQSTGIMAIILAGLVCGAPVNAVIYTLAFLIGTAIKNFIAGFLGGEGSMDSFTFVNAAYDAPLMMVSVMLRNVPYVGGLFYLLFNLYSLFLSLVALRGVKKLSWGKSILVLFIFAVILLILFGCIFAVIGTSLRSTMQNLGY